VKVIAALVVDHDAGAAKPEPVESMT